MDYERAKQIAVSCEGDFLVTVIERSTRHGQSSIGVTVDRDKAVGAGSFLIDLTENSLRAD